MADRALEIDRIAKRYGDVVAVDDLTFEVRAGELFGFVGRNGAGKTTTMRITLGVLAPDAGVVRWLGVPLTFEARRRIGYMPEERGLYPKMHVAEQLAYLGELHGMTGAEARDAALGWLDRFGLADRRDAELQALSLGNQQRVQLAAALVFGPDVLVLDEPFAGLDPVAVDVMAGVLREQADAGVPVIFSSHELELVERLCDRVGIVERGRMVACGTVDELRAGGQERRWIDVPGAPGDWEAGVPGVRLLQTDGSRRLFELDRGVDDQALLEAALATGPVREFERVEPSLGELFRTRHRGGSGMKCAVCRALGGTRRLPTTVLVARREALMRLRSRVFIGGTTVMTVLVVVGIVAASLLAGKTTPVRVGFSGGSQALERTFTASAAALGAKVTVSDIADVTAGEAQVTAGTLDVLVTGSATAPTAVVKAAIPSNVESALYLASEAARLSDAGLPPAAVTSAMALVPVQILQPSTPKDTQNLFAGLAVGIVLWIALGIYGSQVAQGVVEEKATRIMEILLATIRPSRLLAGKVIGIGFVGLLQLTIVAVAALVAVQVTNVASIPALGVAGILGDLFWFLLGFLFYATAYSAVAALVSRQEEVQSAIAPMSILQIAGYLLVYAALPNPSGPLATVCSLLPPFAPILMAVRMAASDVPVWQVGLAAALTIASIVGLTWLAGRMYTNAAMRIGTRVRFMDAFRG